MTSTHSRRARSLLTVLCALALGACAGDIVDVPSPADAPDEPSPELAFWAPGPVNTVFYGGRELAVEEIDGSFVYEGDILLDPTLVRFEPVELVLEPGTEPSELSAEHQALTARTSHLWDDHVVPYAIAPDHPARDRILAAIAHWEANTSLTFPERTSESDYIYFRSASGCSSYIGRIGGQQAINVGSCSTGSIIHEIGHAVGIWHEHSRADRDRWIDVRLENVQAGREHNFETYAELGFDGQELTDALDFDSIMMYGSYAFSRNGQPTIVTAAGATYRVQRTALSTGDLEGLAALYPEGGGEPEYVNGQFYTIAGITVLRANDLWYFWTRYGYKRVELRNGRWYWV